MRRCYTRRPMQTKTARRRANLYIKPKRGAGLLPNRYDLAYAGRDALATAVNTAFLNLNNGPLVNNLFKKLGDTGVRIIDETSKRLCIG